MLVEEYTHTKQQAKLYRLWKTYMPKFIVVIGGTETSISCKQLHVGKALLQHHRLSKC
jgi:hypothetical protein